MFEDLKQILLIKPNKIILNSNLQKKSCSGVMFIGRLKFC